MNTVFGLIFWGSIAIAAAIVIFQVIMSISFWVLTKFADDRGIRDIFVEDAKRSKLRDVMDD